MGIISCLYMLWTILKVSWRLHLQPFLWTLPATIFKKSNLSCAVVYLPYITMKPGTLLAKKQDNQQAKYHKESQIMTCSLSLWIVWSWTALIVVKSQCQSFWSWTNSGIIPRQNLDTMKNIRNATTLSTSYCKQSFSLPLSTTTIYCRIDVTWISRPPWGISIYINHQIFPQYWQIWHHRHFAGLSFWTKNKQHICYNPISN